MVGAADTDEWIVTVGDELGSGIIRFVPTPRPGLDATFHDTIVINFEVLNPEDFGAFLES